MVCIDPLDLRRVTHVSDLLTRAASVSAYLLVGQDAGVEHLALNGNQSHCLELKEALVIEVVLFVEQRRERERTGGNEASA